MLDQPAHRNVLAPQKAVNMSADVLLRVTGRTSPDIILVASCLWCAAGSTAMRTDRNTHKYRGVCSSMKLSVKLARCSFRPPVPVCNRHGMAAPVYELWVRAHRLLIGSSRLPCVIKLITPCSSLHGIDCDFLNICALRSSSRSRHPP